MVTLILCQSQEGLPNVSLHASVQSSSDSSIKAECSVLSTHSSCGDLLGVFTNCTTAESRQLLGPVQIT